MSKNRSKRSKMALEPGTQKAPDPPQESPAKHWFFRCNVTFYDDVQDLIKILDPKCYRYCFQLERGEETGYVHYQGAMSLTTKCRQTSILKWLKPGTELGVIRDLEAMYKYCRKIDTRISGPWMKGEPEQLWLIETLRPWQQEVEGIARGAADRRTIHWYWSDKGDLGRTQLCKYLSYHYNAIGVLGKTSDVLDMCTKAAKNLKIVLFNIPRGERPDKSLYRQLEVIKDGYWFSGKYETSMVNINSPHVFVFANEAPEEHRLSQDRWHIVKIDDSPDQIHGPSHGRVGP